MNSPDRRVTDLLHLLWESFVVETDGPEAAIVCDVSGDAREWRLSYTPTRIVLSNWPVEGKGLWQLMLILRYALVSRARFERRDLHTVHGACVASPEGGLLFPGRNGTGKTSLALSFLRTGYSYLTDDVCPIDLGSLSVTPFPKPLGIRNASGWAQLKALWSPPEWVPTPRGAWLLPATSFPISHDPVPVRSVVFPRFEAEWPGPPELETLSAGRAAAMLGELVEPLDAAVMSGLSRMMQLVPGRTVRFGPSTPPHGVLEQTLANAAGSVED